MIIDDYDDATLDKVREVCQELFHENYINEYVFSPNDQLRKANISYSFIMSHYDAIEELLDCCGWKLHHDEQVRVLHLTSDYMIAKVVLNKHESYFLLALRLLYDDKKTQASSSGEVFVTVREIMEKLTTLGAVDSVSKTEREKVLRALANKNIISKMTGNLGDMDARLAVMPSVICSISPHKTKSVLEMLSTDTPENVEIQSVADGELTEVDEDGEL